MAMSRSEGSRLLTTLPPMEISPLETSSSPATMRSSVDLPQPEGPTMTTNSPSPISALTPWMTWFAFGPRPYRLTTLRREIAAMLFLGIHETLDEPFLHCQHDDGRRQHRQHGGGHDEVPVVCRLAARDHVLDA